MGTGPPPPPPFYSNPHCLCCEPHTHHFPLIPSIASPLLLYFTYFPQHLLDLIGHGYRWEDHCEMVKFVLKMMNSAFQMMHFVFKMVSFVFKMVISAFKMVGFASKTTGKGVWAQPDTRCDRPHGEDHRKCTSNTKMIKHITYPHFNTKFTIF